MIEKLVETTACLEKQIIQWRRDLHQIPECGFELPETAAYVLDVLKTIGIEEIETWERHSGIVATIHGGLGSGRTIVFRADMDALPIKENGQYEYVSRHEGMMHACGHDGHTAMLLGTAKILWQERANFRGTVKLIFQPAEEGPAPGGAYVMIEDGVLRDVDMIFGCHLVPDTGFRAGDVFFQRTVSLSASDKFMIRLQGKGGHGSMPHKTIDAIALASMVYTNLQYIVSRQTSPLDSVCITIGSIHGGIAENVIADSVEMKGSMRSYDQKVREETLEKIERCIKTACDYVGATYEFEVTPMADALICDREMSGLVEQVSQELLGAERTFVLEQPDTASDDFAAFLNRVPGAYYRIGVCSGEETSYPPHSPKYQMDESALKVGPMINAGLVNRISG